MSKYLKMGYVLTAQRQQIYVIDVSMQYYVQEEYNLCCATDILTATHLAVTKIKAVVK